MHKRQLQLLNLLLEATRSKRAVWRRDDAGVLHTKLAGLVCSLGFKYPVLADDADADADAVRLTIGTTAFTFYRGSEGFDLVSEIVAASDPEVRDRDRRMLEHLDELIKRIKRNSLP
jgi:hypothetical protein